MAEGRGAPRGSRASRRGRLLRPPVADPIAAPARDGPRRPRADEATFAPGRAAPTAPRPRARCEGRSRACPATTLRRTRRRRHAVRHSPGRPGSATRRARGEATSRCPRRTRRATRRSSRPRRALRGDEHRTAARALGAVRGVASASLAARIRGWCRGDRVPAGRSRSRVPDRARVVEEHDLRAGGGRVVATLERVDQRLEEARLDRVSLLRSTRAPRRAERASATRRSCLRQTRDSCPSRTSTTPGCSLATASALPSLESLSTTRT